MLESDPLKSRIVVRRLAVLTSGVDSSEGLSATTSGEPSAIVIVTVIMLITVIVRV